MHCRRRPRETSLAIDPRAPSAVYAGTNQSGIFKSGDNLGQAVGYSTAAGRLVDPASGRVMEVYTTEPGMQLYTGNCNTGKPPADVGKGGTPYNFREAVCLETHHFPDSPNKANFPTTVLNPGQTFTSSTVYKFLAKP